MKALMNFVTGIMDHKERLGEIEALVMEEMVAEKICENAKVTEKDKKYNEVMNPSKDNKTKGE